MGRPGPPCPLCGRRGMFGGAGYVQLYIPPPGHRIRILSWANVERTPPGVRPRDIRIDECPLLADDRLSRE